MGKVMPVPVVDATLWEKETQTMTTSMENSDVCNLTVMKTSLFFTGDGFTVYDANCQLVFRMDSYGGPDGHSRDELFLMDSTGLCLLTLRRKRPSLHQRWEAYAGEGRDGSKPIFSVRRSSIIGRSTVTVETYSSNDPAAASEYLIEGSFSQRSCTFYELGGVSGGVDGEGNGRSVVAEIRRKVDVSTNVILGKDVFVLKIMKRDFDPAFAMGIVLVLDQICGDGDGDGDGDDIDEDGVDLEVSEVETLEGSSVKVDSSSS